MSFVNPTAVAVRNSDRTPESRSMLIQIATCERKFCQERKIFVLCKGVKNRQEQASTSEADMRKELKKYRELFYLAQAKLKCEQAKVRSLTEELKIKEKREDSFRCLIRNLKKNAQGDNQSKA